MGCEETREDIEEEMLYTRLEREEIRRQRKLLLEELKLSTGESYKLEKIPDFVDIKYIKEKQRKHYEKLVKQEIKKVEAKKRKEEKEKEELEKELEEERKKEQLLYMPLDMKIKSPDNDLEDIYYLNYVLEKKQKNKEKKNDKRHKTKKKKTKRHKTEKSKKVSFELKEEKKEDEEKYDYMEPVNAAIRTKVGSVKSVFEDEKENHKNTRNLKIDDKDYNDSMSDSEAKNMPYVTPHLQPND